MSLKQERIYGDGQLVLKLTYEPGDKRKIRMLQILEII